MCRTQHGCWTAALLMSVVTTVASAGMPVLDQIHLTASTHLLEINYAAPAGAQPLNRVELWYTREGEVWRHYGVDEDVHPPMRLPVEEDGVYGLFMVLTNSFGASSPPPRPGQAAHQWVLVDTTEPLVQVKQVQVTQDASAVRPTLMIAWTAHDAFLGPRPVEIYYQRRAAPGWTLLAANLANVGRYDWLVPTEVGGEIEIKVDVVDRAGNRAGDVSRAVVLMRGQEEVPPVAAQSAPVSRSSAPTDDWSAEPSEEERIKAYDLYERGVWRKQRGEIDLATERFVEATNLDPTMTTPAFELAEIYYNDGKFQQAIDIYATILQRAPEDRDARRGTALALVMQKNYSEALTHLEQVLARNPEDAQTWLDAGDVFIWMGDRSTAREYWKRALEISDRANPARQDARSRLRKFDAPR